MRGKKYLIWWGCLCLILLSALSVSTATFAKGEKAQPVDRGGTAIVGVDFEPACINPYLPDCTSSLWTIPIVGTALRGPFRTLPNFDYEPDLVEAVEVIKGQRLQLV